MTAALAGVLAWSGPRSGEASDQKSSQSGSSNSSSSNSSNGSNDSSNSSKDSSHSSNASSKDSDNSTQTSPKSSSDWSTKGTSDWSTNSHGGHVFSIALAVVAVGASVVGSVAVSAARRANQARVTAMLAAFMRRQHALLMHDVATAEGPVLAAWAHDLGLSADDKRRLCRALEGSPEQGLLLDALDGPIDEEHARRFAGAFVRATERALGPTRTAALIARAARTSGIG